MTTSKIIHRQNKLKAKAGGQEDKQGFIEPKKIALAQSAIDENEENYTDEAQIVLQQINGAWKDLKSNKDKSKESELKKIFYNYANNIKDIAETFEDGLMGYFGNSLRDFSEKLDMSKTAHHTIVQAHIDVMFAAHKTGIKDKEHATAEELKRMLNKAIEKHID